MSKYTKITLILGALAAACWIVSIAVPPANLEFLFAFAAVAFSIAFLCFLAVSISRRVKTDISPYRVFAVVDGLIGLCVAAYAVYDILTDTGWFAGMLGIVLLLLVLPITLVLLLLDFLVWKVRKAKGDRS